MDAALRRFARATRRELEDAHDALKEARDVLVRVRDRGEKVTGVTAGPRAWVQALDGILGNVDTEIRDIERRLLGSAEAAQEPSVAGLVPMRGGKS